jgi:calmodulin
MSTFITKEQMIEYTEQFKYFDRDGNGQITANELGVVMRKLGQNPTEKELKTMINEVDNNGDNSIDFSEFLTMMVRQQTVEIFRKFDLDGDGKITKDELIEAVNINFRQKISMDEIKEKMNSVDVNNDGSLDYEEFVKLLIPKIEKNI